MAMLTTYILIAIVTTATLRWLRTEAQRPPLERPDGSLELHHGRKYLVLAVACSAVGPFTFATEWSAVASSIGGLLLVGALTLLGLWMLLDALMTRVVLSAQGVMARTPLGGNRH